MESENNDEFECPKGSETMHLTVINGLVWVIVWALYVAFVYKLDYKAKQKANKIIRDGKNIKLIGLFAMTVYIICINMIFFSSLFQATNGFECKNDSVIEYAIGADFLGFAAVLALFSYRLIKTFDDSIYSLTNMQKKLITISLICIFLFLVFLYVFNEVFSDKYTTYLSILAMVYMLCVFTLCLILLKLFLSKLNQMINSFIKQFGAVSAPKLAELNKSIRYHTLHAIHATLALIVKTYNNNNNNNHMTIMMYNVV